MTHAAASDCPSCGTSLSIRDGRCPNPSCPAYGALDADAHEVGTTRLMHSDESSSPYKTIAVGVGALLLVVALGYGLFRLGVSYFDTGRPDPTTLPRATAAAVSSAPAVPGVEGSPIAASASPSPAVAAGARLKVVNTDNQGVRFRQRPSAQGQVLRSLAEGTVVEVAGPDASADGIAWKNVREPSGAVGWVASEFLAPE